ncbi:MAG: hypothetical protein AAGG81_01230 [Chlamydiota bacterium]
MKSLWMIMIITIVVILAIFFYAGIFYPMEETPKLVDEVDTKAITEKRGTQEESLDDIVIFAFQRNHPEEMKKFMLQHNGMKDLDGLERNLSEQDYIAILTALWSEQDGDKRLMWLREKQIDNHPILLMELAVEIMKQNPSLEHFQEALFLLELGRFRTELDAVCITDSSAAVAGQSLYSVYAKAVASEVRENPALTRELIDSPQDLLNKEILEKLLIALKRTRLELDSLPSPEWVSSHALQKLLVEKDIILEPSQCHKKREELIDAYIAEIEGGAKQQIYRS